MDLVGSTQTIKMPEDKVKKLNDKNTEDFNFSFENYNTNYAPGKKGGIFELPMGGQLTIPEGALNKKDHINCGIVPPCKRFQHAPRLDKDEQLHSEIYKVDTSYNQVKIPIFLQIPYQEIDNRLYEINVRGLWPKEEEWVNVGFLVKKDADQTWTELSLHRGGLFVVTYLPKKEKFELTPNGSLYSSRLCRFCTIRCPRKAVDNTVNCSLEVIPIPHEKLLYCQTNYPFKCADLLDCVEMIDVCSSQTDDFRRPITIKMPVPNESSQPNENEGEELEECDVAVIMKDTPESEWEVMESTKLSRRMVSFDVKRLGRFCVVKVKQGRQRRMKEAIAVLEDKYNKIAGCISLFTSFEDKLWTAAVVCYPRSESQSVEEEWVKRKFKMVHPLAKKEPEKTTYFDIPGKRFEHFKFNDPEFYDGLSWTIDIEGNLKFQSDVNNEFKILFYSHLKEHYFLFTLEPANSHFSQLLAHMTVTPDDIADEEERTKLTGFFTLEVTPEQTETYRYIEPLEEVEPEVIPRKKLSLKRTVSLPPILTTKEKNALKKGPALKKTRKASLAPEAMERLAKSVHKTKIICRESRVLSGRSLMNLSRFVNNGLNLAIHLGLSESCVTGLGFDALANGLNMQDITYKILMYWKRNQSDKYETAVSQLALAFQQIGQHEIAKVIMNRHSEGLEINKDCFAFI